MIVKRTEDVGEDVCDVCGGTTQPMVNVHKTTKNHVVRGLICEKHVDPSIFPWELEESAWKVVHLVETIALLLESRDS